ncbi:winged helix-turn-helix domain-containing protein [Aerococcaceae bacterium NML191292]|nr:winged helix-turn-helix domain-containing protein [Aerococcaceae bacterium NML191292]MCW6665674.1 winged helix-turn-helix domain-containing protein [Aerococcaceae bacterium NML191219]
MDYELISRQLRELGHPTRLWITMYLLDHERTFGVELSNMLNKTQGEISIHLRKLRDVGILISNRELHYNFFSLNPDAPVSMMVRALKENKK